MFELLRDDPIPTPLPAPAPRKSVHRGTPGDILHLGERRYQVESWMHPGCWYRVDLAANTCNCAHCAHKPECKHRGMARDKEAMMARNPQKTAAKPVNDPYGFDESDAMFGPEPDAPPQAPETVVHYVRVRNAKGLIEVVHPDRVKDVAC